MEVLQWLSSREDTVGTTRTAGCMWCPAGNMCRPIVRRSTALSLRIDRLRHHTPGTPRQTCCTPPTDQVQAHRRSVLPRGSRTVLSGKEEEGYSGLMFEAAQGMGPKRQRTPESQLVELPSTHWVSC